MSVIQELSIGICDADFVVVGEARVDGCFAVCARVPVRTCAKVASLGNVAILISVVADTVLTWVGFAGADAYLSKVVGVLP